MSAPNWHTATPEAQGIPSAALEQMLDFLEARGVPMHSLLVMRGGALVFEAYWSPFGPDTLHRMFSETKSLVSLAIGLLADAGRLSLDDTICRYFPDKLPPEGPSPELAALTIRDMLRMATPYRRTTYKDHPGPDWVGSFFTAPPDHYPGTLFSYDTSSTHTLCALVERLSGRPLLEYLRQTCLNAIGFSPDAYCIRDPMGISQGGSGLMARPRDMLRLLRLLADGGRFEGRQLLPADYLQAALRKQIDTEANCNSGESDFSQGYGYQFWQLHHNAWCLYGMDGQLAVCVPDQDLLVVTTADTQGHQGGVQLILDALWTCLWPTLHAGSLPADPAAQNRLQARAAALRLAPVQGLSQPPTMSDQYDMAPNRTGLTALELDSAADRGMLHLHYGTQVLAIPFGYGQCVCGPFADGTPCAASGGWKDNRTLLVRICLLGERTGSLLVQAVFDPERVTLLLRSLEEFPDPHFDGTATGLRCPQGGPHAS